MRPGGASPSPTASASPASISALVRLRPDQRPGSAGAAVDQIRGDLGLGRAGDPVGQLVRLVDDQQRVRRHDVPAGEHVDGEQAVVGDHDVGLAGPDPGRLGEALGAVRAPAGAHALAGRHRDQPPGVVVHARVELVAVAGLGLRGPLAQPLDLLAEPAGLAEPRRSCGRRLGVEERVGRLLLGRALQPGQAQVVVAALEHRERRPAAEQRLDRVGQPGQVVVDQLGLQRQGRGRDHHRPVDQQRRRQVGQRLAGAGAGLDQQVLAGGRSIGDSVGHRLLASSSHIGLMSAMTFTTCCYRAGCTIRMRATLQDARRGF